MGHFWPYPSNMEIWSARQFFCHFGPYFAKYQNSEKLKKAPGDIIILYLCTIMMIIWCMVPEIWSTTDIFLSFWASFCPSTAVTTQKIKLWKTEISTWRYHHFTCVLQMMIIWCMIPQIWNVTDWVFCYFRPFFALLPP